MSKKKEEKTGSHSGASTPSDVAKDGLGHLTDQRIQIFARRTVQYWSTQAKITEDVTSAGAEARLVPLPPFFFAHVSVSICIFGTQRSDSFHLSIKMPLRHAGGNTVPSSQKSVLANCNMLGNNDYGLKENKSNKVFSQTHNGGRGWMKQKKNKQTKTPPIQQKYNFRQLSPLLVHHSLTISFLLLSKD